VHRCRTFTKCRAGLGYHHVLDPLFWECCHPRALPYTFELESHPLSLGIWSERVGERGERGRD